jgi:hypothetical protein
MMKEDPKRAKLPETGIYVRAKYQTARGEAWDAVDLAHLTRESVLEWMRDRSPEYLQNTILALLGHER